MGKVVKIYIIWFTQKENSRGGIKLQSLYYTNAVGRCLDLLDLPQDEVTAEFGRILFGTMDSETGLSLKLSKSYKAAI